MIICPYCATENREGTMFCEVCGQGLLGKLTDPTLPTRQLENMPNDLAARATWGTASFGQQSEIVFHVRDAQEPMSLQIKERAVFGRADNTSPRQPDVDLTPFGALEKGVSRIHAAIERSDETLTLVDMGSSNGTHLNGQRLLPEQPRVLRDGDEVRLGKLVAHIYFK